jgi:hypothetical protein
MRNSALGCCGVILGIVLGAVVMVFAMAFLNVNVLAREPVAQELLLPNRPDVTITASNTFINPQLEQAIVKSGLAMQAHVSLVAPNIIRVESPVNVSFLGQLMTVDATVQMAVAVQGGRITLTTDQVEASGIGLPPSVLGQDFERQRKAAEDEINREAQRSLEGTRLVVSAVRVAPEGLSVDLKMQ